MFKLRLLTALILIPLVVWAIFALPALAFILITELLILLAAWEWSQFLGADAIKMRILYVAAVLLLFLNLIPIQLILIIATLWWIVVSFGLIYIARQPQIPTFPKWFLGLSGYLVLIPCWAGLMTLRHLPDGPVLILMMLLLIWGVDTGAYFAGRLFGRRPLASRISPNKTWEGALGALVVTLLVIGLYCVFLGIHTWKSLTILVIVGIIIWFFCIVGDLFESLFKRALAIKDSGRWLPGHGGILDRIDSLTAVAPVFALLLLYTL